MERTYEKASETAKKVRKALKDAFPGVKFYVRSDTYSMGSSVDVHWVDGPMSDQVEAITGKFKSSSFDGMQDMKITTGYMFEGKLYSGADFIHTARTLSLEYRQKIESAAAAKYSYYDKNDWGAHRLEKEAEREMLGIKEADNIPLVEFVEDFPHVPMIVESEPCKSPSNVIDFAAFLARKIQMAAH